MRATAHTQPGPVRRPGRATLRDPRRLVHSPKVPHTKWTETRGPVIHYLAALQRLANKLGESI